MSLQLFTPLLHLDKDARLPKQVGESGRSGGASHAILQDGTRLLVSRMAERLKESI